MRILMLIISSDNFKIHAQHRDVWRSYMNTHPNIDCFFLHYSPIAFVPTLSNNTLTLRGREGYETILAKTIDSLAYLLPRAPYTHVVRTNLSSVWDFVRLIDFLNTCPTTRLYGGIRLDNDDATRSRYEASGAGILMGRGVASGAGILMSRDVAELLVVNRREVLSIGDIDDVVIGIFMTRMGIPFTESRRVDFISLKHYEVGCNVIPPGSFHYRVKHVDELDRTKEPENMRCILRDHILTSRGHPTIA